MKQCLVDPPPTSRAPRLGTECVTHSAREAIALEERFYKHTESYFRFITEPNVEPANNSAEQAIRFVAIHRRLTQGSRSADGPRSRLDPVSCFLFPVSSPFTTKAHER